MGQLPYTQHLLFTYLSEVTHEKSVSPSSTLSTFESSDSLSSFLDFLASGSSLLPLLSLAGRFLFPLAS